jgi:hypothetical protein
MITPTAPSRFQAVPAPAFAIGATTLTYGHPRTSGVNQNLFDYNFLGVTPVVGSSTNPDGSILISGAAGDKYGASMCSARKNGSVVQGYTFGGDCYAEVTAKFPVVLDPTGGGHLPFPAIWALGVNHLAQVGGITRWAELDIMQQTRNSLEYVSMACWIDWPSVVIQPSDGEVHVKGLNFDTYHQYGVRWERATPTTPGITRSYIDRTEVHYARGYPPITWPYGDPGGTVRDGNRVALILGTSPLCPMTIAKDGISVWHKNAADGVWQ